MKLNALVGIALLGLSGLAVAAVEEPATAPASPSPDPGADQPFKLKADCKPSQALLSPIAAGVSEIREITRLQIQDSQAKITLKTGAGVTGPASEEEYAVTLVPAGPELMSLIPSEGYVDGVVGTLFSLADVRIPPEALATGSLPDGVYPATGVLVFMTSFQLTRSQPRGIYTRHIDLYCDLTIRKSE